MPIYEYTCQDCKAQFEKFVRSMAFDGEVKCPQCGGTQVQKGWSVFGTGNAGDGLASLSSSAASSCNVGGT